MATDNKCLVVLIGPTAVGKTELSLNLAKLLSSPVISADSRQIFRGMKIGTAAPDEQMLKQVKHYFIASKNLDDYYSAALYEEEAIGLVNSLFQTHDNLLLTGGSMMYIDAVTKGIDDIPTIDEDTRTLLKEKLEREGADSLRAELKLLDPEYYETVDLKNTKRVVHALEVCYLTGKPFSSFRKGEAKARPFKILKIGLRRERSVLFDRINRRVDLMMEQGLLEEARGLYRLRHLNSLNTVGYKEMFKYIDGEWSLDMAVERLKKNTRVYAKKQMTWFAKDKDITWFDADILSQQQIIDNICDMLGVKV